VADDVQKGETLSGALGRHPGAFDEVFVSLVNTGEVSGTLDRIMEQTATYLERAETLRLKVEAALRYPTFVLTFAGLVMLAMILKIIPMFASIYGRFKVPLPIPTRVLLSASQAVTHNLLLFTLLAVAGGTSLSRALSESRAFPEMLVQMTATGEETGRLDHMLTRTADFYEQRVTTAVEGLSSLVEPVAIVVLGGLVGVMLIALYLPIFNLGQAMRSGLLGH